MNWDEIREIEKSDIGFIGHHSHAPEYLIDMNESEFIDDIETNKFSRKTWVCS